MIKNLKRSVALTGHIKIGNKGEERQGRSGMWAPPQKLDHFLVTKTYREGDHNSNFVVDDAIMGALVAGGFADADGKVRRIPIWLLQDEVDLVYPTAYVAYAGRSMACRGDGEQATRFISPDGEVLAEPVQVPCPCERLEKDLVGNRRCKFSGILHCALRLPGHAVIGSVYTHRTTSEISVSQVFTHLGDILEITGTLRGLPLMLVLRPQQVSPGGKPKTVYVTHVDLCEELVIAQRGALEAANMRRELAGNLLATREADYRPTLQLPGGESAEEQAEVAEEFYPDAVIDSPMAAAVGNFTPPAEVLDAPLSGLGVPAPVPVPPADDPKVRTRRSRCSTCGELRHDVKDRICPDCREAADRGAPAPAPAPPARPAGPDAPEIVATPHQRLQAMVRAAVVDRGIDQGKVLGAIAQAWPDYETKTAEGTWTHDDIGLMDGILGGLEA